MIKRFYFIVPLCLIAVSFCVAAPLQEQAQPDKPQAKTLKVTVSYSGKGEVDQGHGIYMFLFDSPDFVQSPGSVMPVSFRAIHSNGEAATFDGLTAENVYLAVAFDQEGGYDMQGPPPSGTPVAVYKPGEAQLPTPIKLEVGKDIEIKFSFDDSLRMP
jgi:hypothetical protein